MRIDLSPILDEKLSAAIDRPLVVGFSGGGDSLCLLLLAKAWADRRGRSVLALTVDHRLRPEGSDWARWCRARAEALGVRHQVLVWEGPKPTTGVSAAARQGRHRLLAEAARAAGAGVILLGHTADDRAECTLMREEGSNVPVPRAWSPSPVWPEGRGVFLFRPLLDHRRQAIREFLNALGETWIEDPANEDPASARARARRVIAGAPRRLADAQERDAWAASESLGEIEEGPAGDLLLPRRLLTENALSAADLGAALLCAAGTDRPPHTAALAGLLDRLKAGEDFVATLAGARVEAEPSRVHVVRDAGEWRDGSRGDVPLPAGEWVTWEGRLALRAVGSDARVRRLAGHAARLPASLRRPRLAARPAARPMLPLVIGSTGAWDLPTVRPTPLIEVHGLALERLKAARGGIVNEQHLTLMAKPADPS